MDITTQAMTDTTFVHLKGADGQYLYTDAEKTKPCRIQIYGPGSRAAQDASAHASNRAMKRMQDNDGKMPALTAEERLADQATDLAAITIGFDNFTYPPAVDKQGAELFKAFYADAKLGHLKDQVVKALNDAGNFMPGSSGA
jgi:hypothetical protein